MLSRDNTDYNELNFQPPIIGNTITGNTLSPDRYSFKGFQMCIDEDCCTAPGITWDPKKGICVPISSLDHFTTLANDAYEYSEYMSVK